MNAKRKASDKDLPVLTGFDYDQNLLILLFSVKKVSTKLAGTDNVLKK